MIERLDVMASHITSAQLLVALREAFGASAGIAGSHIDGELPLLGAEASYVVRAEAQRRAEFSHGRDCARRALAQLGQPEAPILRTSWGAPSWPNGFTGSITHERCLALAVAMAADNEHSIGIDLLDRQQVIDADVAARFLSREDRWNRQAVPPRRDAWQTVFSAKEAVVKAISPRLERWIELEDISIDGEHSAFHAHYPGLSGWLIGNVYEVDDLVLTTAIFHPTH